jgi:hypothetical protein
MIAKSSTRGRIAPGCCTSCMLETLCQSAITWWTHHIQNVGGRTLNGWGVAHCEREYPFQEIGYNIEDVGHTTSRIFGVVLPATSQCACAQAPISAMNLSIISAKASFALSWMESKPVAYAICNPPQSTASQSVKCDRDAPQEEHNANQKPNKKMREESHVQGKTECQSVGRNRQLGAKSLCPQKPGIILKQKCMCWTTIWGFIYHVICVRKALLHIEKHLAHQQCGFGKTSTGTIPQS